MAQSEHIKLGYLRDPENHEMYFPYTHYLGVVGLDTHVLNLIGGTVPTQLSDLTNDLTSIGKITLNGTSVDVLRPYGNITEQTFYAPSVAGSSGQILKSTGSTPNWSTINSLTWALGTPTADNTGYDLSTAKTINIPSTLAHLVLNGTSTALAESSFLKNLSLIIASSSSSITENPATDPWINLLGRDVTDTWKSAPLGSVQFQGSTGIDIVGDSGTVEISIDNTVITTTNFSTNYPDLNAIEGLIGTSGFLKKTAANTWTLDTNTYITEFSHTVTVKSGYQSDGTTEISGTSSSSENPTVTLGDSGVTSGSYGDSSTQTPSFGSSFKVPQLQVNAKGIVVSASEHNVTLPADPFTNHNYTKSVSANQAGTQLTVVNVSNNVETTSTIDIVGENTEYTLGNRMNTNTSGSSNAAVTLTDNAAIATVQAVQVPFSAIVNDTATGNSAVTIVLNGNFN